MKHTFLALAISLACGSALAAAAADNTAFIAARQQFAAASGGDASARDAAIEAFEKLSAGQPGNPVYLAYQGAGIAMRGRDAMMPWDKMKYAEKGADMVQKAVTLLAPEHDSLLVDGAPASILTRMVAANTLLALPDFMHRRADGKRALQGALESQVLAQAPAPLRASVFAAAARVASEEKRNADEIGYLRQAVATQAGTPQVAKAAARLKELGQ
ncbi:hypothetical protein GM658_21225 [Pseudoduganella eburnea]|uniref:Sel1 repeat family protein n=1 Tax=Massilia eburnea TaxID=1776165 RepID=A0A6L6QLU0_9BURK|nr:hypothetical protein [Massilia eburnea]MTW13131.1 hypothetical protein [Massilia eburnea]